MKKAILAFLAALVTWVAVVSILDRGLRVLLPGYATAEPTFAFTLGMMTGRLVLAAIASLAAGAVTAWIAPAARWVPWILGVVLLATFIPSHMRLWHVLPLWYHLTFLLTLVPLVVLGARGFSLLKDTRQGAAVSGQG